MIPRLGSVRIVLRAAYRLVLKPKRRCFSLGHLAQAKVHEPGWVSNHHFTNRRGNRQMSCHEKAQRSPAVSRLRTFRS